VDDQPSTDQSTEKPSRRGLSGWQEGLLLAGTAIVLSLLLKTFFVQAFYIPSESMEPGFIKNDRILVQKVSYWGSGTPRRGDIIVFKDPGGWLSDEASGSSNPLVGALTKIGLYPAGGHLVKRVVGVAGDTITCCDRKGRIRVNGVPLDEIAYIEPQSKCNGPMTGDCRWTAGPVPAGRVFVMGDNRNDSADSTVHLDEDPFVPTDLVVGKVSALFWPLSRFHVIHRPGSFDQVP